MAPSACRTPYNSLSTLLLVKKSGTSAIRRPDEWIEIEVTVDSGACVTVMPTSLCPGISFLENRLSRKGVKYEFASGAHISNLGERRCDMMTIGSLIGKRITYQVADVHKPLLSVGGCADFGVDCFLGELGGFIQYRQSGGRIPLERRENLYIIRTWIKYDLEVIANQPFAGPG